MKLFFVQHDSTRLWVLVDESMIDNLPEDYINNVVEVTGYEKGALHYDVSFGHITGSDWREFDKIMRILEDKFYTISENLCENMESFMLDLTQALNLNNLMCGVGVKYSELANQPVRLT